MMNRKELKEFLDAKAEQYNNPDFLREDPLCIPHSYNRKEDIEISGLLTATIAWGNRKSIINSSRKMMSLLEEEPFRFVMQATETEMEGLTGFVHRTFNGTDLVCFVKALRYIYTHHSGLEAVFAAHAQTNTLQPAIAAFKQVFFEVPHLSRSEKHISDPSKGSAAKRINMFLRWMVRYDNTGVDFGIWQRISPAQLSCPLDVHSGRVARKLGLLKRKQNDSRAVLELDQNLRQLDPADPVKYDFALFGLCVFENF